MENVDLDVVLNNILPCLDGPSLASVSCTSNTLNQLISSNCFHLWSNVVYDTWPSLDDPRLRQVISTFQPDGPFSFFSQSYYPPPLLSCPRGHCGLPEFVSAVDIRYKGVVVFSKTVETDETETKWFRCDPFRVDLVDQKEVVSIKSTVVKQLTTDDECSKLSEDMTLSWIVIDPLHGRATNLSTTGQPVSVQRHWLSGEVMVDFCSVFESITGKKVSTLVKCGIRVTLGGSEDGEEMQVREVSMVMEDMEGKHLNGEGILVILETALQGIKGRRVGYEEFLVRKRKGKESEMRREKRLDLFCVGFGATLLSCFFMLLLLG